MPAVDEPLPGMSADDVFGATPQHVKDQLGPKTNRADAEAELEELRQRLGQGPRTHMDRVRVRSSVRVVNQRWFEISLQIRLDEGMPWLDVINRDHPLLQGRNPSDIHEDYVTRVIKRFLIQDSGILRWDLGKWEARIGQGVTEYRAWLTFQSRSGVAVRTREDGMLNVYGL